MSSQPAVSGSDGVNAKIADLRKRVRRLEGAPTIIEALDGASINPGSITTGAIAAGAITSTHIQSGAITADQIAAGAITTTHLTAGSILANHIQAGTIAAGHIAAGAITAAHIQADQINAGHIVANTISATHITAGAITATHITAGAITADHITANAITAALISANAINAGHIQAGSISTTHLQAGSVTADQILANSITAAHIAANTITATQIAAGSITAGALAANSIETQHLSADSITSEKIQADQITSREITATTLQTLYTETGLLTGGTIRGGRFVTTLTDAGSRVDIDSTGLKGYSAAGIKTFEISSGTGVFFTAAPESTVPGPALSPAQLGGGNILPNSSFEQGTNTETGVLDRALGWEPQPNGQGAGYGVSSDYSFDGTYSFKIVSSGNVETRVLQRRTPTGSTANTVPVVPGRKYTISYYVYTPSGTSARSFRMAYYWYTSGGAETSGVSGVNVNGAPVANGTVTSVVGEWTRVTLTTTAAPAGTATMGFLVNILSSTGESHYLDAFQIEQGDVPTAYKPKPDEILYGSIRSLFIGAGEIKSNNIEAGTVKAQHITVAFGGTNGITNSSFENNTATSNSVPGWTDVGGAATFNRSTAAARTGAASGLLQATAASSSVNVTNNTNRAPVVAGQRYTASAYAKAGSGGNQVQMRVLFYNLAGSNIATVSGESEFGAAVTPDVGGAWTRFSRSGITAPTNATSARLALYMLNPASASDFVYMDDVQFEVGSEASPYARKPTEILPGELGATLITPNSITTNQLYVGTTQADRIQANNIATDAIEARTIKGGAITADKISIGAVPESTTVNGSFEDNPGTLDSQPEAWYGPAQGAESDTGTGGGSANDVASTNGAWHLRVASRTAWFSKKMTVEAGRKYRLRFNALHTNSDNDGASKSVYFRITYSATNPAGNWVPAITGGLSDFYYSGTMGQGSQNDAGQAYGADIPTTWTPFEFTWTAPATAKYASIAFYNWFANQTGYLRVDNVTLEPLVTGTLITPLSVSTTHLAASSVTADKIQMTLSGGNMVKNSEFRNTVASTGTEVSSLPAEWNSNPNIGVADAPTMAVISTGGPIDNGSYLRLTNGSNTGTRGIVQEVRRVESGKKYSFSFYGKAGTAGRTATLVVNWMNSSNAQISSTTGPTWSLSTAWARYETTSANTLTSPTGAVYAQMYLNFNSVPASEVNNVGNIQLEASEIVTPWRQYIDPTVIDGGTITSPVIRTSPTNPRLQLDGTDGLFLTDSTGIKVAQFRSGGGGLDLRAAATYSGALAPAERTVRWLNSGGSPLGEIGFVGGDATENPQTGVMYLGSRSFSAGQSTMQVLAHRNVGLSSHSVAYVEMRSGDTSIVPQVNVQVKKFNDAVGLIKVLLNGDGGSDWLQLYGVANKRTIQMASGWISWPGLSDTSSLVTWSHQLQVAPVFFVFFMLDQSDTGACAAYGVSANATDCTAYFKTINGFMPAAGQKGRWCAAAIG